MGRIVTGSELAPKVMEALKAWGIPDRAVSIDLHIGAQSAVIVTCTFYVTESDGALRLAGEALELVTKRYRLFEVE